MKVGQCIKKGRAIHIIVLSLLIRKKQDNLYLFRMDQFTRSSSGNPEHSEKPAWQPNLKVMSPHSTRPQTHLCWVGLRYFVCASCWNMVFNLLNDCVETFKTYMGTLLENHVKFSWDVLVRRYSEALVMSKGILDNLALKQSVTLVAHLVAHLVA